MGDKIKTLDLTRKPAAASADDVRAAAAWSDYDPKNEGYRPLAGGRVHQDLSGINIQHMQWLAYFLYDTSGLVKRFVHDTKDFVLGGGVTLSVENDTEEGAALAILEEFWHDPMTGMDILLEDRMVFFSLLGELCLPVSVNKYSGRVQVSYIDPMNIFDIATVPGFAEHPDSVILNAGTGTGTAIKCVRPLDDPRKKHYGRLDGECFFWALNKAPNATRGRSDLVHLFDFIDGFEQGLFDELDRLKSIKAFVWDVLIRGGTDEDVKRFIADNPPPKPNTVRAHNERIEWKAVSPQLNQQDSKAFFDLMRSYIAGGMNRPDSWFGSGGKAYETEAELMGAPTFKALESRQRRVRKMINQMLRYVLDQAIIAGRLKDGPYQPKCQMPPVTPENTKEATGQLKTLSDSLAVAEDRYWITRETAARIYHGSAVRLGVEYDPAEGPESPEALGHTSVDYERRQGGEGVTDA